MCLRTIPRGIHDGGIALIVALSSRPVPQVPEHLTERIGAAAGYAGEILLPDSLHRFARTIPLVVIDSLTDNALRFRLGLIFRKIEYGFHLAILCVIDGTVTSDFDERTEVGHGSKIERRKVAAVRDIFKQFQIRSKVLV